jgi:hypothetical protein
MRLGGVIFASVGIIITVLVANGRWSSVWAAALGDNGSSTTTDPGAGVAAPNSGSFGTWSDVTNTVPQTATGGGW